MAKVDVGNLLARAVRGFERSERWTATGFGGAHRTPCLVGGRRGEVHWWGFGQPADLPSVIVVGEDVFVRGLWLWDLNDQARDLVGDRWLRRPFKSFRRQNLDVLPSRMLAKELQPPADPVLLEERVVDGRRVARVEAGTRPWRCVWEVGIDDPELHVPLINGGYEFSLTYEDSPLPITLPSAFEVLDVSDVLAAARPGRTRPAAMSAPSGAGGETAVLGPDETDGPGERLWTVVDYDLAEALGVDCLEAQEEVRVELARRDLAMADRVAYDSEGGCFFAYCEIETDALAVADVVAALKAGR